MFEPNDETRTNDERNMFGFWTFGLIIIVLGAIGILYYLRYVKRLQYLLRF